MFKIIKTIRRILAVLFLLLGTVVVATGVYCYRYQAQIIQRLVDEANKRLSHPIQMRAIQLTGLKTFPNIALTCYDVVVKDRIESARELITVRKIYCVFDIWQLVQGQYVLAHLYLEHGKFYLGADLGLSLGWETGVQKVAQREATLIVGLQKIHLKDIEILCGGKQQHCRISSEQMQASLKWEHSGLEADLQGKIMIRNIQLKDASFAQNLPLSLKAALSYDQQKRTWTLRFSQLKHGDSLLAVQGNWGLESASSVALTIQGKKVSPQLLLHCLPQQYYQKSKWYDLRGGLSFNLSVHKQPSKLLALQGNFLLRDGTMSISQSPTPIELCQLSGHLSIPNVQNLETASLSIDQLTSRFASSKLEGSLTLRNFSDLYLQCTAEATLDLASLSRLLVHPAITDASGKLALHWELKANMQQLIRRAYTVDNFSLSGGLQTQAAQFKLGSSQLLCKNLMGKLVFKDNALVMKDFSGSMGPGSFVLAGTVQNLLPCLFSCNQKLCVDAQLYMDYLDLDALLCGKCASTAPASSSPAKFDISPYWAMNLDCDIQQLHCRRFRGKNIRGRVKVKDQKLIAEKLQLGVSGGKVFLDGSLDASTDDLNIHTVAKLQGVRISDLFYMFENFHQDFLMDSHLSGKVFSDVDITMEADKQWNMRWDALNAAIDFRMIDGGLHNFDPMQQLAKYVDKEQLIKLRFSELKNHILIKDKTIYIPPMEVHTSPTRIQLSGTHTFDGKIDYSFGVPFAGFQERVGAPEEIGAAAGPYLFFKLQGDTGYYKISYDAEASRKNLAKAIKTQGKILRALVQGAYQENKQLQELAPDDYFEFDE